jgi:hypothetical protein
MVRHAGVLVMSMDETMKDEDSAFLSLLVIDWYALFMTAGWL